MYKTVEEIRFDIFMDLILTCHVYDTFFCCSLASGEKKSNIKLKGFLFVWINFFKICQNT